MQSWNAWWGVEGKKTGEGGKRRKGDPLPAKKHWYFEAGDGATMPGPWVDQLRTKLGCIFAPLRQKNLVPPTWVGIEGVDPELENLVYTLLISEFEEATYGEGNWKLRKYIVEYVQNYMRDAASAVKQEPCDDIAEGSHGADGDDDSSNRMGKKRRLSQPPPGPKRKVLLLDPLCAVLLLYFSIFLIAF